MGCGASGGDAKAQQPSGAKYEDKEKEKDKGPQGDHAKQEKTAAPPPPPPTEAPAPQEEPQEAPPPVAAPAQEQAPPPEAPTAQAQENPPSAAPDAAAVAVGPTATPEPEAKDEPEAVVADEFDESAFRAGLGLEAHECLDLEFALEQVGDDAEFLVELKDSIEELMNQTSVDFEAALAAGDWGTISEKAHALKGATSNLGMNRIRFIALGIEQSGRIFNLAAKGQAQESEAPYTKVQATSLIGLLSSEWAMFGTEFEALVVNGVALEQAEGG